VLVDQLEELAADPVGQADGSEGQRDGRGEEGERHHEVMLRQGRQLLENGQAGREEREHVEAVDKSRDAQHRDDPAQVLAIGQTDRLQLPDDRLELPLALHQPIQGAIQARREDHRQADESRGQGAPDHSDQDADIPITSSKIECSGDARQRDQAEQPEDAVQDHRRDRLRLFFRLHAAEKARLDHVAADSARDHQVEDVADEAQADRVAEREHQPLRLHELVPAEEGDEQGRQVDRQPDREELVLDGFLEDFEDLVPVLADDPEQQDARQGEEQNVDQGGPTWRSG
jgi:hypothetical protein